MRTWSLVLITSGHINICLTVRYREDTKLLSFYVYRASTRCYSCIETGLSFWNCASAIRSVTLYGVLENSVCDLGPGA